MRQKIFSKMAIRHVAIALVLAISLVPIGTSPVAAQDISEYFEITYEPVKFVDAGGNPKTEIHGNEVFYAEIQGSATCIKTLEFPYNLVSEAKITSQVVAEPQASGDSVTLNPGYTVTIKPFPVTKDDTVEINRDIPLQFPVGSQSGDYDVVGKLVEAKVNTPYGWITITSMLPPSQPMGSVTYTALANNPPNTPSTPLGPSSGNIGTSCIYSTSATDPDGDQVKYTFDWGDGTSETGLVNSGTSASKSHTWSSPGIYYVKAKATDSEGASSIWSSSKKVTISASNNPPNQPSNPSPANHATDVPINADLSWTGGDPDAGDTVTYDVYFGTSSPPPFKETIGPYPATQSPIAYDPAALSYNTKYYWYVVATDNLSASTPAPLPGDEWEFTTAGDLDPLVYDANPKDGEIQKGEAIKAVQDYFGGDITKAQAIEVVMLYFG